MGLFQKSLIIVAIIGASALSACNEGGSNEQISDRLTALEASRTEPETEPRETADTVQQTEDAAGDVRHTDGVATIVDNVEQCVNVHFSDIPRGEDPRNPSRSPALVQEMDSLAQTAIVRTCSAGYTGSLSIRVCSENAAFSGLCVETSPRS